MKGLVLCLAVLSWGCLRPGEDRALADLEVGVASTAAYDVATPAAHVRAADGDTLELWASYPVVPITIDAPLRTSIVLIVNNCMPGAELVLLSGEANIGDDEDPEPTVCRFAVEAVGSAELRIAPPDFDIAVPFRFAVMGDIQTALSDVGDVFAVIASDPTIRFVVSTGDLVEDGLLREYEELDLRLRTLPVPYFSTIGNHELGFDAKHWATYFGRHNLHFPFKGVLFTFLDTGSASIDPIVYDWLDGWLDDGQDRVHIYGQHYPAIDPVGVRQGAMRSRKEAAKLLSRLARGEVDATFYGHIHSFYSYENAGMPAYISGGGGAWPERWDGIGRHFLAVDVDPSVGIERVSLVRVTTP